MQSLDKWNFTSAKLQGLTEMSETTISGKVFSYFDYRRIVWLELTAPFFSDFISNGHNMILYHNFHYFVAHLENYMYT